MAKEQRKNCPGFVTKKIMGKWVRKACTKWENHPGKCG